MPHIQLLRQQIRQQRRLLNRFQLRQAEIAVCHRVLALAPITQAQHIGVYLDAFGEVPTKALIKALSKLGKTIYIPSICTLKQTLRWQRISWQHLCSRRFYQHRLGMYQAMSSRPHSYAQLDCVLMPLVAFDQHGHRIGMGGGFYDRTLVLKQGVIRIGLAHDFQLSQCDLVAQPWDQSLDKVCTPRQSWHFRRSQQA